VFPNDFIGYYMAGNGIFLDQWWYSDWLAPLFKVLAIYDPFKSAVVFAGFQTFCFMLLIHKMFEVRYGWLVTIITLPLVLPQFDSLIKCGNITITLALVACYPVPSLLAILVKPHYALFSLLHAIAARSRRGMARSTHPIRKSSVASADLPHPRKKAEGEIDR